ncbi:MAG: carotenoid biosynthesis protein [Burkholderiaceae bacterium]|jgi:putative membrane protein
MTRSSAGATGGPAAGARTTRLVEAIPAAITLAGMIATPLARRGGPVRRTLSTVVVSGLFATTSAAAARRWGAPRTAIAASGVAAATTAVEHVGTATGRPFGAYGYTGALRPQVAGVPAIVPLAWFAMAVPARESAHAALAHRSTPVRRVALGAVALTAWDLFLDPQMVGEGYWRWVRAGRYRGIPVTNYLGWLATSAAVMAALEVALPPDGEADRALVAEYGVMAGMETLGFAAFFRDRVVAVVGGAAMMPIAAAAARSLWRTRHWHMVGPGRGDEVVRTGRG